MYIFVGNSKRAEFARKVYSRYMTGEWFGSADVMQDCDASFDAKMDKAAWPHYSDLKHAIKIVTDKITELCGEDAVEKRGSNRRREYRYVGENPDPLREIKDKEESAKAIDNINTYWKFCQDTAGLIPMEWLEYFLEDTKDLLNIENTQNDGQQIIYASSVNASLKNKTWLPNLYESIKGKQVLEVAYRPFGKNARTLIVSPHVLSEYNGRWHLLCQDCKRKEWILALDRIEAYSPARGYEFIEPPKGFYAKNFENRIGVTRMEGERPEEVHIRAHSQRMFYLLETKKLHRSQETLVPYDEEKGFGEFVVRVIVNNEFIGRVLQMGEDLEVASPENVRQEFRKRVEAMLNRYKSDHATSGKQPCHH